MVKHAILLADKDWCEAASSGRVRVYHFIGPRKRRIRSLGKGSVCVVITKSEQGQPQIVYGEFTVTDIREVNASEYNRLAMERLIYKPEKLRPREKRWVIFFDEFREYSVKQRKNELIDVKTSTSNKPISEWVITGLTYIDDQALEGIRRGVEGPQPPITRIDELEERVRRLEEVLGVSEPVFSIKHECAELMLLSIGKQLGFRVYTADPSKSCGGNNLGSLADMNKDDLSKYVGPKVLDPLSRIDVVWYKEGEGFYLFEVVIGGSMSDALLRLSDVSRSGLNARMFIVSIEDMKNEYKSNIERTTFKDIRNNCKFISMGQLAKMFILTNLWKQSIKPLQ